MGVNRFAQNKRRDLRARLEKKGNGMDVGGKVGRLENLDIEKQRIDGVRTGRECADEGVGNEGVWFGDLGEQVAGVGEGAVR